MTKLDLNQPYIPTDLFPKIVSHVRYRHTLLSLQKTCKAFFPLATTILYQHVRLPDAIKFNWFLRTIHRHVEDQDQGSLEAYAKYRVGIYRSSVREVSLDLIPSVILLPNLPPSPPADTNNHGVYLPHCHTLRLTKNASSNTESVIPRTKDSIALSIDPFTQLVNPEKIELHKPRMEERQATEDWVLLFTELCTAWTKVRRIDIYGGNLRGMKTLSESEDVEHHFHITPTGRQGYGTVPGFLEVYPRDGVGREEDQAQVEMQHWIKIRRSAEEIYKLIKPPFSHGSSPNQASRSRWTIHLPYRFGSETIKWDQIDDMESMVIGLVGIRIPERYDEVVEDLMVDGKQRQRLTRIRWRIEG
ncbi:hypothetical protein I302_104999 [Kwoniella bestiolae CBS 10118]|uniref:F-box domain-containing protein n=1 Tax=Kwoniella bestiolae CBS 10118 TaxID=1296100 RepID=A0A1B9FR63_9TREE|nr:hypothetical protein I302_08929 [Kwoniella bestiolae CBS 10118]OCF21257.1 hypothetical protein I302_08929 [Kwoniella bestiolae CBS 10118]